jgi:glycosyltransferase involved in cell wall biosynthesis
VFIGIERTLARATDRIIAISPRICDELQQQYRIGVRDQYRVIVLGFDLRPFAAIDDRNRQAARRALEIPSGAAVVTTVGRITPIKDQRLFLDVAKRVLEERADVVFLIVGDGELRPELEQLVRALAIAGRVRFLGWRRDLETIYAATDVFLLTSRNEGTPVALIESLAAGCAGVSTDVGGVGDVLTNDEVGLLAPAADGAKLATHVLALLGDPERRQRMGEAGRRSVLDRFSVERLVDDIDRVYRELVDAPSAEATP